jgi:hypothetical protein
MPGCNIAPGHDWRSEMITVSTTAKDMLRAVDLPEGSALRLEPAEDGRLAFVAGPAQQGDQVVEEGGEELLRIAGFVSEQLDGHNLDRIDTPEGPRLTMTSPPTEGAEA